MGQIETFQKLVQTYCTDGITDTLCIELGYEYETEIAESFHTLRRPIDKLEELVDNKMWPLPKYRELLFIS